MSNDSQQFNRSPLNAPGPFYTCGNCLACHLPEDQAPDLLAPLEKASNVTHFIKQPQTPDEIERACKAIEVCCVADLRYGGTDKSIIERLNGQNCDHMIHKNRIAARLENVLCHILARIKMH